MAKLLQIAACCLVLGTLPGFADDTDPSPSDPANASEPGVKILLPPAANPLSAVRVDKRLFGVVPNYRATDASTEYKPLTSLEKFKLAERDTFDWPNYFLMAGFAMQTQIAEKGWHQSGFGRNFGEYYARTFGDALIGNYVTEAVMPTLLHEDPRFFRSGIGPLWKRAFYAARQVAVTRTTDGHHRLNCSEFLGNTAVVAATSLYYPGERRLGPSAERVAMA